MRVRDHKAEYAAIKARAQAAGLTVRDFRRARKAEPTKYYSPRAQVTLKRRQATPTGRRVRKKVSASVVDADKARTFGTTKQHIENRLTNLPPEQRRRAETKLRESDDYHDLLYDEDFYWYDKYDRINHVLWYGDN